MSSLIECVLLQNALSYQGPLDTHARARAHAHLPRSRVATANDLLRKMAITVILFSCDFVSSDRVLLSALSLECVLSSVLS